jgi:acetyl esterase/lipase
MTYEKIMLEGTHDEVYLEAYKPKYPGKNKRKAILVLPGGGYKRVCSDREGEPIALAFLPHGFTSFVLEYTTGRRDQFPCQLIEVARAIKYIKDNAEKYSIDPEKVFVIGFSAGGHLAGSAGVLWKHSAVYEAIKDMPYGYNKPRGVMLMYPVIFDHLGSFWNLLLTKEPTQEQMDKASPNNYVDSDSSPAFIMHTANDRVVPVFNSIKTAEAYATAGVPFELHIYPDAPHGVSLGNKITSRNIEKHENTAIAEWVRHAAVWADGICQG